jgi:hypothetical protein
VSIRRLKTVHSLTHPSAKIERPTVTTPTNSAGDMGVEGIAPLVADPKLEGVAAEDIGSAPSRSEAAAVLLAALAAEAEHEGS